MSRCGTTGGRRVVWLGPPGCGPRAAPGVDSHGRRRTSRAANSRWIFDYLVPLASVEAEPPGRGWPVLSSGGPRWPESVVKAIGICGSTRAQSTNMTLLKAALECLPAGVSSEVFTGIGSLPIFNPDEDGETRAASSEVQAWRDALREAGLVVISSPEYAFGVPGGLKNALDWIVSSGEFMDKPVALITASPNAQGGDKAHAALSLTLGVMGAKLVPSASITVPFVKSKLDAEGRISDPDLASKIRTGLSACLAAAEEGPT